MALVVHRPETTVTHRLPTAPLPSRLALPLLLCLAAGCSTPPAPPAAAAADPALMGCWKNEKVNAFFDNGNARSEVSDCDMRIDASTISMHCPRAGSEIDYAYHVVRPGVYAATMVRHTKLPALVGSHREYEYQVSGDRLNITTYPQTTQPKPSMPAVRVESTSVKTACS